MPSAERAQRVRRKIAGLRLRAVREQQGMTLEEAAKCLSLTGDELRARELGSESYTMEDLWRLCHNLGVPAAAAFRLVGGETPSPRLGERGIGLRRKALGAVLAESREARGLTCEEAEARAGLPEGWLRRAELGEVGLCVAEVEALAELYGRAADQWLRACDGQPPAVGDGGDDDLRAYGLEQVSDPLEFIGRPGSRRLILAAMALSRLDDASLAALEDAILSLRSSE